MKIKNKFELIKFSIQKLQKEDNQHNNSYNFTIYSTWMETEKY
jgi:hypothetical protein